MNKDIFISYKNDNAGNNFATRLKEDLENSGYSVYFNPDENHSGDFPERLRDAIKTCKDFILVVSQGCLTQLMENNKIDWIREEILTAYQEHKHIIPIIMSGVEMPKDKDDMPAELRFLPDIDNITMPEQYKKSPFEELIKAFISKAEKDDIYRDTDNSNSQYDVHKDFDATIGAFSEDTYDNLTCFKAKYEAAIMYFYGFSNSMHTTDRNFEKAYELFAEIASCDNDYKSAAESMLGRMYYDGTVPGEKQSYEKSLDYHRKSASGSVHFGYSAARVAFMQQCARGCDFDFDEIENYYLSFIENGDDTIKMDLAHFYMNYGQFEKAAEIYNSMETTNPVAEYKLGMLYKNGVLNNPIKPDFIQASYHFQNAINCEYPYPDAANQLGLLYFAPTGKFRKNFEMAQKYFEIAADMGNCSAQYMLGYMYEFGYVKKDIKLAIHYFTMAANQGEINSYHHLAMLYQQTECKNYHKAFRYAKTSASNSIPEGEFIYANLLYMGRGCTADETKALEYYHRALEHGMEQAAFMIDKINAKKI